MIWKTEYTDEAIADLDLLSGNTSERIVHKISFFCESNAPLDFAKPLTGKLKDFYRFRVGNYRIIFQILPDGTVCILNILSIKHRKDVYR